MYLVISEKPSVAQSIAKVIGAYKKEDGYLAGHNCMVSWCLGHLAEYVSPEGYDEKYKTWNFDDLPIIPERWKLQVAKDKKAQFLVLKDLLNRKDLEYVVNACDAGREGELIFKRVYDLSGSHIPVKRLWISSMEDKAILEGFANLKSAEEYKNLAEAAVCRAQADWLVGMNATRAFTKTYNYRLAVGRVQTPTLAMLVERERAIKGFLKEQYFVVHILKDGLDAVSEHISSREEAEHLARDCEGRIANIIRIKAEHKTIAPPRLYDLTTLQREANRLFGFTAKQTLDIAQALYEKKLLTYPRTDSQFLTEDMEATVTEMIKTLEKGLPFLTVAEHTQHDVKRVLNSKKVSDHHAIIPTTDAERADLNSLSNAEQKILVMVVTRLICATSVKHQYISVNAELLCCGNTFTINGKSVTGYGWKIYDETMKRFLRAENEEEEDNNDVDLLRLQEGQKFYGMSSKVTEHWTQPPKNYTEDSLLAAMERAGNTEMNDDVERKGLGTPATRASIIEKLISSGYAARKKKHIVPTEAGSKMIALMPEYLTSAQMTADWENRLLLMERGETSAPVFMQDIFDLIQRILSSCKEIPENIREQFALNGGAGKSEIGKCPVCGSAVREGKTNFYCINHDCAFVLWKESRYLSTMRKTVDKKMAVELLSKGKTHVKDFYSAKKNKMFEADLVMALEGSKVSFKLEFPKQK